jgi:hypothetical protein
MSRIYMTLAAAAVSALAAAAIVALPAIGDEPREPPGVNDDADIADLVSCLRAQGLDAPSAFEEFKPWMARQAERDPDATKAAERACDEHLPRVPKPAASVPDEFIACVRAKGLDAPTSPREFDRWVRRMEQTDPDAIERIFPECKLAIAPKAECAPAAPEDDKPAPTPAA